MPWTASDPTWAKLTPYQRAAAMSLMEADKSDPNAARHTLAAMINRSNKEGSDLGVSVSSRTYQPTTEESQHRRLGGILSNPDYPVLSQWAEDYSLGKEPDPTNGATHFLAPEKTMLSLEADNPQKYKSWRGWTGYSPETGSYKNVTMRDNSHAFLNPDGAGAFASTPAASGAYATAASPPPSQPASGGAFTLANLLKADPQTGSSPIGKVAGSLSSLGSGGDGADQRRAQLAKSATDANNAMLADDAKLQVSALQKLLNRGANV